VDERELRVVAQPGQLGREAQGVAGPGAVVATDEDLLEQGTDSGRR
jgi:hypothetical protein